MLRKFTFLLVAALILAGCAREDDPAHTFRAIGTEPFWGLRIDDQGLRFTTPENMEGTRFPALVPAVDGDALRWSGQAGWGDIDVRIWPGECSDMMSDKLWTHEASVEIDGTSYRGCAEIPVEASSDHDPVGDWIIVDHRLPGISAMGYDEAVAWHGRTIHLGAEEAVSGNDACERPDYRYREAPADDYLRDEFRIAPAGLGLEDVERFGVTEIFCGDDAWSVPGGLLIWADNRPPYTAWDGVFFDLRRVPEAP